jgi:hypothetical protein
MQTKSFADVENHKWEAFHQDLEAYPKTSPTTMDFPAFLGWLKCHPWISILELGKKT